MQNLTPKELAAIQQDAGIIQSEWRIAFMEAELAKLPKPDEGATVDEKQSYAKHQVQINTLKHAHQALIDYREFIKTNFNI